jgi:hypothetical protein
MLKCDEIADPNSCLNKAKDDERIFVLLARDPAAPAAIRAWIGERLRTGKNQLNDPKILEAQICAHHMSTASGAVSLDELRRLIKDQQELIYSMGEQIKKQSELLSKKAEGAQIRA